MNKGFGASLFLVLLLAGCGKKSDHATPPGPRAKFPLPEPQLVSRGEPGRYGGRLRLSCIGSPQTFNPVAANETASLDIIQLLYSSLINFDWPTHEVRPGLAESWQVEPDQKTWTFKLRRGVRWTDGQPLTADDVVFTWNDVMYNSEIRNYTAEMFRINGKNFSVSKVDDFTVKVATPEVFAPLVEYFGSLPILPRHTLNDAVKEKRFLRAYGANARPEQIVTSGPFKIKQHNPGRSTILERNPDYWVVDKNGQRLPYFEHVIYNVAPSVTAMTQRALKGDCDVQERIRVEDVESLAYAASKGQLQFLDAGIGLDKDFLWFNQNTGTNARAGKPIVEPAKLKWFRNAKFRQAVASAIDRDRIVREIYGGRAVPSYGYISEENQKWNNTNITRYAYNPAKARALLAEIGIQDRNGDGVAEDAGGIRAEIDFNTNLGNPARERTALLIQKDLAAVGVKLLYQAIDFNLLVEKINNTFDYECILMGLGGGGLDPVSSMTVLKSSDITHQWFPLQQTPSTAWEARIDQLMDAQMRTLDFAERKKYFDEVQAILAEQLPMIYTVSPLSYAAVRAGLGNVRPTALSQYRVTWNIEELYFKK